LTKNIINRLYDIRPETPNDFEGIRIVNHQAFKNQPNEANLIEAIRKSELFIPQLSLVAVLDDDVIGHILFSPIFIETNEEKIQTLGLAPMAVKQEYQGVGIGSKLVTEGLKLCKEQGHRHVFVLGHPEFYPKFGFIPSNSSFGIEGPFPVQDQYFMTLELEPRSLEGINGKVKYPPAFDVVS
jgi:putative acetyltransferase